MLVTFHLVRNTLLAGLCITFLFVPLIGLAQTSSDAKRLPPAIPRGLQNATTTVSHPPVTVDVGIKRRFNDSPQVLADHELSASQVINKSRLQIFARHLAMTEPIKSIDVGSEEVSVTIDGPARLFGFIPTSVQYSVTATFSDGIDEVTTRIDTGWVRHLTSEKNPDVISSQITQIVYQAEYLSVTQLKAVILEAIVDTVTGN